MPATTRGPLPPGVYWRRRVFVGLLALSIVFVIASALGAGSDGSSGEAPVAQQAGGVEATHTVTVPTTTSTASPGARKPKQKQSAQQRPQLAEPSGTCAAADIRVTPQTKRAIAGRPVTLTLSLQTRTAPACFWRVGPQRLAVRISGSGGEIWSTRHCKEGIPTRQVILRRNVATEVNLVWDARRSDDGCPEATDWVLPGEYVVTTAVYGGEPQRRAISLVAPKAESPTPKPSPKPTPKPTGNSPSPSGQQQAGTP